MKERIKVMLKVLLAVLGAALYKFKNLSILLFAA